LQRVQIECLPYEEILEKYDRPTTCFYLDPPYWERKLYKFNFTEEDFRALEQRLQTVKGKFLLSLDDHPEIRKLFGHWNLLPVDISYTAQKKTGKRFRELIITNFENREGAPTDSTRVSSKEEV
jgi:DNA adenine methylase